MKILFFSYAFPNPITPTLGTFNRTMIAGLATQHDVQVVSPVPFTEVWKASLTGQLPRGLNDSTFQAVPGVTTQYCTWYYTPKLLRTHYGDFMRRSVGRTLHRTLEAFRPDIVLSYWTHPDGEVAVAAAHQHGIRAVAMVGGSDVLINGRSGARRDSILNVLRAADGVVTVSEDIRNVLLLDGIPSEKVFTSRRGIDRHLFHDGDTTLARRKLGIPNDRPILLNVGRLVDVKGHKYLIEACRLLVDRGIQFRCEIIGDGPLRPAIEQQIDQHGLEETIKLRGSQSPAQLAEWYRAADLSILTSLSEGVPNVLLESIASGTPFIASNVGGIPEITDETFDRLVPAADPVALADAIADQLPRLQTFPCRSRRFEPQTVRQAAESFSALLRSIHSGRITSPDSKRSRHENDPNPSSNTRSDTSTASQSHITTPTPAETLAAEDEGARTGEHYQLRQAIQARIANGDQSAVAGRDRVRYIETVPSPSVQITPRQPPRYDDNAVIPREREGVLYGP
ncbi:glycosyltransferase [Schlesneria paludicola]|uniref:glycosyltransferase n=1 Tax=Schlesneria paludicola TaxID=360056 RepID=UPI00029AB9DE|nr:glycosyltransferase [Schlesneria paludicola]